PTAVVRTSYTHKMANGSQPKLAFTMRRLAAPEMNGRSTVLQTLALTSSDDFTVGDVLELKFGSELQTIQFMGRVNAFRPFGSVDLHLSPDAVVEYSYATSVPDSRLDKGFDTAPADLSESGPRMSLSGFAPRLEKAHHHEVSFSRRMGKTNVQVAKFSGTLPGAKTRWMASYRWTDGPALTPVDMFNASAGQADPFLNLFVRQPIPKNAFLPCHMDAIVDVRNLLAQGYVPVMGQDGRTVYLVQSARAIRGGVAFTF